MAKGKPVLNGTDLTNIDFQAILNTESGWDAVKNFLDDNLLRVIAKPNLKDAKGTPLLIIVTEINYSELLEALLKLGGLPNITNNYGKTAIHEAASLSYMECVKLLLQYGADVNAQDNKGATPLHYLTHFGVIEPIDLIDLLLTNGADINAKNTQGNTPLHIAINRVQTGAAQALLKHGADINVKTNQGMTPLDIAAQKNDQEINKLVRSAKLADLLYDLGDLGQNTLDIDKNLMIDRYKFFLKKDGTPLPLEHAKNFIDYTKLDNELKEELKTTITQCINDGQEFISIIAGEILYTCQKLTPVPIKDTITFLKAGMTKSNLETKEGTPQKYANLATPEILKNLFNYYSKYNNLKCLEQFYEDPAKFDEKQINNINNDIDFANIIIIQKHLYDWLCSPNLINVELKLQQFADNIIPRDLKDRAKVALKAYQDFKNNPFQKICSQKLLDQEKELKALTEKLENQDSIIKTIMEKTCMDNQEHTIPLTGELDNFDPHDASGSSEDI